MLIVRRFYHRKKFTAVLAAGKNVESNDELLDDKVLSKFKVFGFCRLGARVFQLHWLSARSIDM